MVSRQSDERMAPVASGSALGVDAVAGDVQHLMVAEQLVLNADQVDLAATVVEQGERAGQRALQQLRDDVRLLEHARQLVLARARWRRRSRARCRTTPARG